MKSRLPDIPAAIRLSRATLRNIHENLFWAFIYNIIGIPLAAGVFIGALGWQLNPMFAAAAMNLSSFSVSVPVFIEQYRQKVLYQHLIIQQKPDDAAIFVHERMCSNRLCLSPCGKHYRI